MRPSVMKVRKVAKASTPAHAGSSWPSTNATASQSLAVPSVKAAAKTTTPMSSVRGSSQAERCRSPGGLGRLVVLGGARAGSAAGPTRRAPR